MRFELTLQPIRPQQRLSFNYQYAFSSFIYHRLESADAEFSQWLHETGFVVAGTQKRFKHFTFSWFRIASHNRQIRKGDDFMTLGSQPIQVVVSFYVEKAAEDFIIGLFQKQELALVNNGHRAEFYVSSVHTLPAETLTDNQVFRAVTPMVVAEKRADGKDDYLSPLDERFTRFFAQNLYSKYQSLYPEALQLDAAAIGKLIQVEVLDTSQMRSKLIAVKENKTSETKVKGYENFTFRLNAPKEIVEVGFYGGMGKFSSSVGGGYVEKLKQ